MGYNIVNTPNGVLSVKKENSPFFFHSVGNWKKYINKEVFMDSLNDLINYYLKLLAVYRKDLEVFKDNDTTKSYYKGVVSAYEGVLDDLIDLRDDEGSKMEE